jgi:uncharacterized protein (DUF169 family)
MDLEFRDRFMNLWDRYFQGVELPITFYYTDMSPAGKRVNAARHRCVMADLMQARKGKELLLDAENIGCFGGQKYLGFREGLRPNFEYFLSCGIPGELEGERYKRSPELVREVMKRMPEFKAPRKSIAFKRWDKLDSQDEPEAVIFFAGPDILSGLFTLANFDEADPEGVIAPFGAGCSTIVMYPYLENGKERPKGILGMFDVSARPFVPEGSLSIAFPMTKFVSMVANMEESFLNTSSWARVMRRIAGQTGNSVQ